MAAHKTTSNSKDNDSLLALKEIAQKSIVQMEKNRKSFTENHHNLTELRKDCAEIRGDLKECKKDCIEMGETLDFLLL